MDLKNFAPSEIPSYRKTRPVPDLEGAKPGHALGDSFMGRQNYNIIIMGKIKTFSTKLLADASLVSSQSTCNKRASHKRRDVQAVEKELERNYLVSARVRIRRSGAGSLLHFFNWDKISSSSHTTLKRLLRYLTRCFRTILKICMRTTYYYPITKYITWLLRRQLCSCVLLAILEIEELCLKLQNCRSCRTHNSLSPTYRY